VAGPVLRRLSIASFTALFAVATLCLTLGGASPVDAGPDPVAAYSEANEQLALLLLEREALEVSIAEAMSAERSSLAKLGETEGTLSRLVGDRRENDLRRAELVNRIAAVEAQTPTLESVALSIDRQIEGHERWLLDGERPRAIGSRAYLSALGSRDQLSVDREAATSVVTAVREDEATQVHELGRLNTEITFWERQADALSRQVGALRARALDANAHLGEVQRDGLALADEIRDRLVELRRFGYPIGVGFAAEGKAPVPAPVEWPASAPRGYVLPTGTSAGALRAAEPLRAEPGVAIPLPAPTWTLPVRGVVTTPFGESTPYQPAHWAVDVGSRLYEPVRAAADGVVEFAGLAAGDNRLASYGMVVVIRHEERLTSLYAHLDDRAYGALVQPGEPVRQGQVIGYVGLTGNTTGPHVHFEARLDGRPFDPMQLVGAAG
jgi:murein DD-endopeptidase MepM/ murein hydrolase activator NlpD